jgi:hypothetical protein
MTPEERKKVVKKVVFFAGKAAPACMFLSNCLLTSPFVDRWFSSDYIAKLVSTIDYA